MNTTLDIDHIRRLIDLVAEEHIAELSVQDGNLSIRIERAAPTSEVPMSGEAGVAPPPPPVGAERPVRADAGSTPPITEPVAPAADTVTAPMVGTFYGAAQAGGPPLVSVGSVVEVGTPLCVIEAMKMLNEVASERSGTVTRVLCENGQMVESGQPLFVIA